MVNFGTDFIKNEVSGNATMREVIGTNISIYICNFKVMVVTISHY